MRAFFLPLIIAVAPGTARAALEVPKFNKGGFLISLQAGAGVPHLDLANLDQQALGFGTLVVGQQVPGQSLGLGLRLAYNILGYASLGADLTATGWSVFETSRGGAGFLVGLLAVHPVQFFFINKEERPFGLDLSTHVGLGYSIAGGGGNPAAWGLDGLVVQWGMTIDYFFNRYFGLEFFAKCNFLRADKVYFNWDAAHQEPDNPFYSRRLNPVAGGTWWHTGLAIVLRIGD